METKKKVNPYEVEIDLGDKIQANYEDDKLTLKNEKGEISKKLFFKDLKISTKDNKVLINTEKFSKRNKKIIFTYKAHINNMIQGLNEGFTYELRVVYSKFPIMVETKNGEFVVKNLLGEKKNRTVKIYDDVKVDIKGKDIIIFGIDKERVGQMSANIEQLCRITHFDRRVIQDGIYITKKPHKIYTE